MMELQKTLQSGTTPQDLLNKYFIKSTRHGLYPHLVLFKYNQILSPFNEQIVRESRGIILDESNNWKVISRPFNKFFNLGEHLAADIDWSSAKVLEKADGSLCQLYFYNNEWHVATSGTPDASGEINGTGITFKELFWDTFKSHGYKLPDQIDRTFLFELMSPLNRVVVQHQTAKLLLLAVRNLDGQEYNIENYINYLLIKSFKLSSIDDIIKSFETIKPLEQEGYVVVDKYFNRIKVKHPGYISLHHLRDGMNPKRILEVIRKGEADEVLTAFPEWKDFFNDVQTRYNNLAEETERDYYKIKDINIQKDFALFAIKSKLSAALFQIRQGRIKTPKEYMKEMHIDKLADLLNLKTDNKFLLME